MPAVGGRCCAQHADASVALVDLDLKSHRAITRDILVLGETDAASPSLAFFPLVPTKEFSGFHDHVARALVLHEAQAILHRVHACRHRQLVDEGFNREHVGVGAKSARR